MDRSGQKGIDLRDWFERSNRLDADRFQLFPLDSMIRELRAEDCYGKNGQNGITLLKAKGLGIVLEVVAGGRTIDRHRVVGPAVVHVVQGSLRIRAGDELRVAHAGELAVVPRDRERTIRADSDAAFVWAVETIDR